MKCPRLRHFRRLNSDGTMGVCGHMTGARRFTTYDQIQKSQWIEELERKFSNNIWPDECTRCRQSEDVGDKSIRQSSIDRDKVLKSIDPEYIIAGGVLDNICNSACQTCNPNLSTKIGSLESKTYKKINNYENFFSIPQDRILEVDVNGGEPTASKNYKMLLSNLPPNTKILRMNTNGSRLIKEIETILQKGITVIVTVSLDGIGDVHDYVRWPIKWNTVQQTIDNYVGLQKNYKNLQLDTWTTVSCLNIADLPNIQQYVDTKKIKHNWAFLEKPDVLSVKHTNWLTTRAKTIYPQSIAITEDNTEHLKTFLERQDSVRGIEYRNYLNF